MIGEKFSGIEELLPGYLSGTLPDKSRVVIDEWRKESPDNETLFQEYSKAWEALPLLHEMEHFNSFNALKKVNKRIAKRDSTKWLLSFQRIAAIFLLPLIAYAGYLTYHNYKVTVEKDKSVVMQTIKSHQGMISEFLLADGTKVWLNAGSELQFPTSFVGEMRNVSLKGEAFFEVTKDKDHPFRVKTKDLFVDVLGTSFNINCYDDDNQTEVVLTEGKVSLTTGTEANVKYLGSLVPGQRAVYNGQSKKLKTDNTDVDKYIAWRDGKLIFRDDPMDEVAKRMSHWFNVEIVIKDAEIKNYVYKATFINESLYQVLNLLKLSAPISYSIVERKLLPNGEYSKQKVYIMKKKI